MSKFVWRVVQETDGTWTAENVQIRSTLDTVEVIGDARERKTEFDRKADAENWLLIKRGIGFNDMI